MGNKREFKKYVEACGASVCEGLTEVYDNVEGVDKEKLAKALEKVLGAVGAACANANITFDKGHKAFDSLKEYSKAKKDFYKKLFVKVNTEFDKELDEAVELLNAAVPQEVKDANKSHLAK